MDYVGQGQGQASRTPRNCYPLNRFLGVQAIRDRPSRPVFMRLRVVLQGRLSKPTSVAQTPVLRAGKRTEMPQPDTKKRVCRSWAGWPESNQQNAAGIA